MLNESHTYFTRVLPGEAQTGRRLHAHHFQLFTLGRRAATDTHQQASSPSQDYDNLNAFNDTL